MNETTISILFVLIAIGIFYAGRLWESRRVLFWKIQWIKIEHELARLQNRTPRNIDDLTKE